MIRSANHSSFPKVGETPLDQQFRAVRNRHARGAATEADVASVAEEVTTIVVAEQSRAFIDIVTDGMIRWDGLLSHLARSLDGLACRGMFRWFETNFYDRRPEVIGEIRRRGPFTLDDYRIAKSVSLTRPVKQVLPGPVTFARMARDRHYGSLESLSEAVAACLAEEVAELAAEGATVFQIDEPLLCRHPEDAALVARCVGPIFEAAGPRATTVLSTYFGDLTEVAAELDRLPGTHIGLDMVTSGGNFDLLERLPATRGLHLGLFDARSTNLEDAADVAELLEPYREVLTRRDVMVGPNAGLELLPRDQAFDKLLQARYLVEKLTQDWTWD